METLQKHNGRWLLILMLCGILAAPILANAQNINHVTSEANHPLRHKTDRLVTDTKGFNGILNGTEVNVQIVLDKLDDAITPDTPLTVSIACSPSQLAFDNTFLYVCIGTNTWRRVELASWGQAREKVVYAAEDVIYAGENVYYP